MAPEGEKVVLFAPLVRDADALARFVEATSRQALICRTHEDFMAALADRPLCAIVTDEGAGHETGRAIEAALADEPSWSTLPLIFAVRSPDNPPPAYRALMERRPPASVVVLQRPVPPATLRSVLEAQAEIRRRQFETSELLQRLEREESSQRFLLSELRHRTGNILSILQATLSLTAAKYDSVDGFVESLGARLQAIATASRQLSGAGGEEKVTLRDLLRQHTAAYRMSDDQVVLDGAEVTVDGTLAFDLALMVHEMATNAAKYGAFAREAGKVHVAWDSDESGLALTWTERGGPPVQVPEAKSFGMRMIEANARKHRGECRIDFAPEGLIWTLRLPKSRTAA